MKKIEITTNSKLGRERRKAIARGLLVSPMPHEGTLARVELGTLLNEYRAAVAVVGHELVKVAIKEGW